METEEKQVEKKDKPFINISGNEWLNIVNSFGDDKLGNELKEFYYKFNDGRFAVVLKNNWKTIIGEIVDTEEKLDSEEDRLKAIARMQNTGDAAHTNAFLDLGKLFKPII